MYSAEKLKQLRSKRIVVVVVKWRYGFCTRLENMVKPADVGLVGLFASPLKAKVAKRIRDRFDEIVWYNTDYDHITAAYEDTDSFRLSVVEEIIHELSRLVGPQNLSLIAPEVGVICTVAHLNSELRLSGPKPEDYERFNSKPLMKAYAEEFHISVIPYFVLTNKYLKEQPVEVLIETITGKLPDFPLFIKPSNGVTCMGATDIENRDLLATWITDAKRKTSNQMSYLVEKAIRGTEIWLCYIILPNGRCTLHTVTYTTRRVHDSLVSGHPITIMETQHATFPGVTAFGESVCAAFRPPPRNYFNVQAFAINTSGDYLLTELALRNAGLRGTGMTLVANWY